MGTSEAIRPLRVEEGSADDLEQIVQFPFGIELREKRKRCHAHSLTYDAQRHSHQSLAVA